MTKALEKWFYIFSADYDLLAPVLLSKIQNRLTEPKFNYY